MMNEYIDLTVSIFESSVVTKGKNKDGNTGYYVLRKKNGKRKVEFVLEENFHDQIFPLISSTSVEYETFLVQFNPILKSLKGFINDNRNISLEEAINHIDSLKLSTLDSTDKIIRSLIAKYEIIVENINNENRFTLNENDKRYYTKLKYYDKLADDLIAKSEKIEYLISHFPSRGNYRENLLISLIRNHIPEKYGVSSGFILGKPYQVDILIYDKTNYAPYFNEDNIVVVDPKSVRGIIEVKTTLSSKTIIDALDHIHNIYPGLIDLPVFKGIFSFKTKIANSSTIIDSIVKYYNSRENHLNHKNGVRGQIMEMQFASEFSGNQFSSISQIFETIDSVCVLKKYLIESMYINTSEESYAKPGVFEVDTFDSLNLSTSLFIRKLLSYLDIEQNIKSDLYNFVEGADRHTSAKNFKFIYEHEWAPPIGAYSYTEDTHPRDFNHSISQTKKWLSGNLSKNQLLQSIQVIK